MRVRKFYRNAYPSVKKPLLHHQRDADSFNQLMPHLIKRGYEYGGLLLNFPAENGNKASAEEVFFPLKNDLIVMTTRPPLDEKDVDHLRISTSGTRLESEIFKSLRKYFPICSRRQVALHESFDDKFESGYSDRASIQFTGHGKITRYLNVARYQATVEGRRRVNEWHLKDGYRTAAYLLYIGEAWDGGPDLLVSFAMTGSCNLIWSHLIRSRYPEFLERYRFVVAEIIVGDIPEVPMSLEFSEHWEVKILLNQEL